jgi:hypothetical protein
MNATPATIAATLLEKENEIRADLYSELMTIVAEQHEAHVIARVTEKLAVSDGRRRTFELIVKCVSERYTIDMFATRYLLDGADDSWSGRCNDVRRSRFDGIRAAINQVLNHLGAR